VTESFVSPAARGKTEREIEEHRRWQQLSREFVEVNTRLCRLRPAEEQASTLAKKTAEIIEREVSREVEHLLRLLFCQPCGDGDSFRHVPGGSGRLEPTAAV
jgi:hypothetical protein